MVEQMTRRVEAARETNQLLDVFEPFLARLGSALAQHGADSRCFEHQGQLIRDCRGLLARNRADRVGEGDAAGAGLAWQRRGLDGAQQGNLAPGSLAFQDLHGLRQNRAAAC